MVNPPSCVRLSGNICGLLLGVICVFGGNVGKGNQHVKRRCRCRAKVVFANATEKGGTPCDYSKVYCRISTKARNRSVSLLPICWGSCSCSLDTPPFAI